MREIEFNKVEKVEVSPTQLSESLAALEACNQRWFSDKMAAERRRPAGRAQEYRQEVVPYPAFKELQKVGLYPIQDHRGAQPVVVDGQTFCAALGQESRETVAPELVHNLQKMFRHFTGELSGNLALNDTEAMYEATGQVPAWVDLMQADTNPLGSDANRQVASSLHETLGHGRKIASHLAWLGVDEATSVELHQVATFYEEGHIYDWALLKEAGFFDNLTPPQPWQWQYWRSPDQWQQLHSSVQRITETAQPDSAFLAYIREEVGARVIEAQQTPHYEVPKGFSRSSEALSLYAVTSNCQDEILQLLAA